MSTISLPKDLILVADRIAKEKKISRSKVISACLQDLAEKQKAAEMVEGYMAVSGEQKDFAATASGITAEVLPEWS
ncbi:MAG: hypothetical protein JXA46_17145 [Dehalococcoidales bacterium]|nr:hypothetical protein [Dehalococcoidales bacterium]